MEAQITVEFIDETGELDFLEVEFTGYPRWINDSYSDEYGLVEKNSYLSMADSEDATWNHKLFTDLENQQIKKWFFVNYEKVYDELCEMCALSLRD